MKRFICLISFVFFGCAVAMAYSDHRGYNLDSLETAILGWTPDRIASATDEELKPLVRAYTDLMNGYLLINGPRSEYFARKIIPLARQRGWLNTEAGALRILGQMHWAKDAYDSAAWYYKAVLATVDRMAQRPRTESDPEGYDAKTVDDRYSSCYGAIGNLYSVMDSIPQAMAYYRKAGEIFDRNGWNESNSVLYYNIGETWVGEKDYRQALPAYEKSLQYAREAGDSLLEANALKGLGGLYMDLGKTGKALRYLKEADRYYSVHADEEFRWRLETLGFMEKVLTRQKKQWLFVALGALLLLALTLTAQLLARRVRHLQTEKEAADAVITEALQELPPDPEEDSVPTVENSSGEGEERPFLTAREADILLLIAAGQTSPQIAERLCLSLPTIKWYRKKLLIKFEAANTADLVFKAKERGLI